MTLPLVFVSQWDNAILYQVILDYILPFHSIQLFLDRIILSFRKPFLSFYIFLLLIWLFMFIFFYAAF